MNDILYNAEDIKTFLKKEYDLDWKNYEVIKNGCKYCMTDKCFKGGLKIVAIVYRGQTVEIYTITISNNSFNVYGKSNQKKNEKWKKLLIKKCNQEQIDAQGL